MTRGDKSLLIGAGLLTGLTLAAIGYYLSNRKKYPALNVVPHIDLEKYSGEWFEIAKLPARFEKDCTKVKAQYSVNKNGVLEVHNTCRTKDNKLKHIKLKAEAADDSNARLNLHYLWPFKSDYQILAVGPEYEYAMVGTENRKHLWFLSRTPELDLSVLGELMSIAKNEGFNTENLIFTHQ
ncbi:MAG: lipocalin family protein [Cytophagaceae bacterium]